LYVHCYCLYLNLIFKKISLNIDNNNEHTTV
jgi:hypothetical protein